MLSGFCLLVRTPLRPFLLPRSSPGPGPSRINPVGPIDLSKFGPHHTAAGSFGHGRCAPSHPFGLQGHPLRCPGQLQSCAAAEPAPSAGPPESGAGRAVSTPLPHLAAGATTRLLPFAQALPTADLVPNSSSRWPLPLLRVPTAPRASFHPWPSIVVSTPCSQRLPNGSDFSV